MKTTLKHRTADGVLHTRETSREYTHVRILRGTWDTEKGAYVGDALSVHGWSSSAESAAKNTGGYKTAVREGRFTVELVNGGARS